MSTASGVVGRVCATIWDIMKVGCIPEPDEEVWYKIAAEFEKHAIFPTVLVQWIDSIYQ